MEKYIVIRNVLPKHSAIDIAETLYKHKILKAKAITSIPTYSIIAVENAIRLQRIPLFEECSYKDIILEVSELYEEKNVYHFIPENWFLELYNSYEYHFNHEWSRFKQEIPESLYDDFEKFIHIPKNLRPPKLERQVAFTFDL
jgi:hypothetical protein